MTANKNDVLNSMDEHIKAVVPKLVDIYRKDKIELGIDYGYLIRNRKDWNTYFMEFELSNPDYINIPDFYRYYYDIYKDRFIDMLYNSLKKK